MTEKYNPWTVVNVVFRHLAEEGCTRCSGRAVTPRGPPRTSCGPSG